MPTTEAPDLTLVAKTTHLADALVVVLIEGLEAWKTDLDGERHNPSADGVTVTIPWAGDPRYALGVARLVTQTGVADEAQAQAMLDRAASWDLDEPLDKVIRLREAEEAKHAEQQGDGDIAALMAEMFRKTR